MSDIKIPEKKVEIIAAADKSVDEIDRQYRRGLITADERYKKVIDLWTKATDDVTAALMQSLDRFNPVYMMANSGARGNIQQIRQLAGMRGLMADPSGRIIDLPIKANFREGLTVLEYFISTHGARKGLADTALRTADSGYLTRRLVDVAQDVIVREDDCDIVGFNLLREKARLAIPTSQAISAKRDILLGRVIASDVYSTKTGELVLRANTELTDDNLWILGEHDMTSISVIAGDSVETIQLGESEEALVAMVRDAMVREMLGKITFESVRNNQGEEIFPAGVQITEEVIDQFIQGGAREVKVRYNNIKGIQVEDIIEGTGVIESLKDRIVGRIAAEDVVDEATGDLIIALNEEIDEAIAAKIVKVRKKMTIRSVLTCRAQFGVCRKCYGRNLATGNIVDVGEAVGIIAAQSIGEPGTQLTMRTFHTGGVAGDDITQGLPRVEELFEARKPKRPAIISEGEGKAEVRESKGMRRVTITPEVGEERAYQVPYGARMLVKDGQMVEAGDRLTEGAVNPHDILRVRGLKETQRYLVYEVQKVYKSQGVEINDKHIEVMVRQMMHKVKVEEPGDTELLPGEYIDISTFEEQNAAAMDTGGEPAVARPILLGITKASLATDSFLSAASFQETTRVLTEAAIKGKIDPLLGLKENVIIGKLVPAGTGMSRYRNIRIKKLIPTEIQ
jgi:DNA-directed RNA polymerase subunit beta'